MYFDASRSYEFRLLGNSLWAPLAVRTCYEVREKPTPVLSPLTAVRLCKLLGTEVRYRDGKVHFISEVQCKLNQECYVKLQTHACGTTGSYREVWLSARGLMEWETLDGTKLAFLEEAK